MVVLSLAFVINSGNVKCRIYEDDYETTVYDFNNNIRRRDELTDIEIHYSHVDE